MSAIFVLSLKLLVLSAITLKRQLIHNRTAQRSAWNQSYDYIVVGAGAAGCVVAGRLTENPNISAILLEAGGPQDALYTDVPGLWPQIDILRQTTYEWNYYPESTNNYQVFRSNTGRILGGSSSHNGMEYHRGNRRGYDEWAQVYGAKGWSFRDVLPYFKMFENNTDRNLVEMSPGNYGTDGPVQLTSNGQVAPIYSVLHRVYRQLGFNDTDLNGANQNGMMLAESYIGLDGFRSESARYVDPNPHPNNLYIVTNSYVIRILFNGLTAVGVEFVRNDTHYRVYARREVIISGGPYQSPQLLLLSGLGPKAQLNQFNIPVLIDLPVGLNFQYHPALTFNSPINYSLSGPPAHISIDNLSQLYFNISGPLSRWPTFLVFYNTVLNKNKEWPNVLFYHYIFIDGILSFHLGVQRVSSRGVVSLQSSNPNIIPRVVINFPVDKQDLDNLLEASKYLLYVMERTPVAQYITPPNLRLPGCPPCQARFQYECNETILCYIRKTLIIENPSGSCRMGDVHRSDVVVDPQLRVKHAQNLRICDSSIFPVVPNGGTTAATIMVGEKCARLIRDSYHQK